MPQTTSPNFEWETKTTNKGTSFMKAFILSIVAIVLLVGAFGAGYYTNSKGYKVTDSNGANVVKTGNAAQTVKEENARLGREVVGKSEAEAEELLKQSNRALVVNSRDGKVIERTAPKTFTNLTVDVKDGKVVKVLGWY